MNCHEGTGWKRLLPPVVLFLFLACIITWPIAVSPDAYDHADSLFNTWLLSWNAHSLVSLENPLQHPVFLGFDDGDGRTDLLLTQTIPAIPLLQAGAAPIRVHNLLFVLSLAFAGLAVYMLATWTGLNRTGALFSGTAFLCLPFIQSHLWHLQLMSMGLAVLALRQGLMYVRNGTRGWLLALLILLQGAASLYYWYFLDLALLLMAGWSFACGGRLRPARLLAWTVAGNVLLVPLLTAHFWNAAEWSMDGISSTDLAALLSPWHTSLLLGWMRPDWLAGESAFWPGLAVVTGAAWWLLRERKHLPLRNGVYLLILLAFFLPFSLGPTLSAGGHPFSGNVFRLLGWIPGIGSIRLPGRAGFLFLLPMILAAGRVLGERRWLAACGALLCLLEVFPGRLPLLSTPLPPWTGWLEENRPASVVFIPLVPDLTRPEAECLRLYGSIGAFIPMVNGYATSLPLNYSAAADILNTWPSPAADSMLNLLGVESVISSAASGEIGTDTLITDAGRPIYALLRSH